MQDTAGMISFEFIFKEPYSWSGEDFNSQPTAQTYSALSHAELTYRSYANMAAAN